MSGILLHSSIQMTSTKKSQKHHFLEPDSPSALSEPKGGSDTRPTIIFGIKLKLNVGCVQVAVGPVLLPIRGTVPHAS